MLESVCVCMCVFEFVGCSSHCLGFKVFYVIFFFSSFFFTQYFSLMFLTAQLSMMYRNPFVFTLFRCDCNKEPNIE